ncbi:uncharacterized protein MELLADRAFT_73326 [Melampsora larici-populina 98AG31]|uniref:Uncharacterized protein n=1 Tax=Melampsora larici-populina (strain 98AG31 / pathotype 3-4-7) TaxID=747676 RepID=F4S6K0_MELLP|nr:uncharacterized protein MELLADRAFT_73326 [Melampsora larici-populina 98AG31]EGF99701.1 hypothetical protein MELLADRAFT_73326 [Melampsora larici-populina 98AG31]
MANLRFCTVHSFRYQLIRLAISYFCVFNFTAKCSSVLPRAAGAQYTSLITFGDSFTSNGRNADPLMNELYAPLGEKGRAVNWPNIFLKDVNSTGTAAKLYNYAFNGAPANSNLTYMGIVPDTRTQIEMFMTDSKAGKIDRGGGRVLYTMWVGINPLKSIWFDACDPQRNGGKGAQHPTDPLFVKAVQRVQQEIDEVSYQMNRLRSISTVDKYVVITVPDLSDAANFQDAIKVWTKGDVTKAKDLVKLLQLLTQQYNKGLRSVITTSNTFLYDISNLWNSIRSSPQKYGFKNVTGRCYDANKVVCSNPDEYLYWDHIHPTPHAHRLIGNDIYRFAEAL